ncbi:hypothetical protein PTKIN_Ptkin10aG0177300 [Pterospermum kingtungense]
MLGHDKGGKGLGKRESKRYMKVLQDNIQEITKPTIRRLVRRGDVKQISGLIYEETCSVFKIFMENVIRDVVAIRSTLGARLLRPWMLSTLSIGKA